MSITTVATPMSLCRVGIGRCDITPPVGIYHRFWGAAVHDCATAVHRPLTATVLTIDSVDDSDTAGPFLLIAIDHCLFRPHDMDELLKATSEKCGVPTENIHFCFSHTHSGGHICSARADQPGGDLIEPYLHELPVKVAAAFQAAKDDATASSLTYASTTCAMGHQRDYYDEANGIYVCGYNPDAAPGLPVNVVRITNETGDLRGTIVSYPCHPTTLAWDNTLISPDYIGSLRETVETATDAPCLFFPAPCGDIGPKVGFVGDTAIADRNGRELAYAALSALESMPPVLEEMNYAGPVISGATIGTWETRPIDNVRQKQISRFRYETWNVSLSYVPGLPSLADAKQQLANLQKEEQEQREAGKETQARKTRALVERKRRQLERLEPLPQGETYPFSVHAWQLGDAYWVAVEGEPYQALQKVLIEKFPHRPLIVIPLDNGSRCSYLPTEEGYDKPLYQVEVSLVAAGSLEKVAASIGEHLEAWDNAE